MADTMTQDEINELLELSDEEDFIVEDREIAADKQHVSLNVCGRRCIILREEPYQVIRKRCNQYGYLIANQLHIKVPLRCIQYFRWYNIEEIKGIYLVVFTLAGAGAVGKYKHAAYQNIGIDCKSEIGNIQV